MKLLYTDYEKDQKEKEALIKEVRELKSKIVEVEKKKVVVNTTPSVSRDNGKDFLKNLEASLKVVTPEFDFGVIPVIRKLSKINPDVNQALNDFIKLANTGHKIKFDDSVSGEKMEEVRNYLTEEAKNWHTGAAGMNGIVNKMFRQMQVGGALSNEWIPNMSLDGIEEIRFLNPENVRFIVEKKRSKYHPYQQLHHTPLNNKQGFQNLRRLNTNQYKYYALNGDTDLPYGIPPYIAALEPISTQRKMVDNINFIIEMMGILGYIDAKIDKPDQQADENDEAYEKRLNKLLTDFKDRVKEGVRDGISVGFMDDHEFDFKQTAKDARGVKDLFDQNELLIAGGLNYDAIFMGKPGSTETLVTVMFTKMISSLTNIQNIVKENLEFGYKLALTLKGFKFKSLHVEFNKSTVTDNLKYQQAKEILTRNLETHFKYGLISLQQFADELGYESPDQKEPRISLEGAPDAMGDAKKKEDREKDKDKSDRKSRDKSNPQGTVKRQNKQDFSIIDKNTIALDN
jgi:hypothetical protein